MFVTDQCSAQGLVIAKIFPGYPLCKDYGIRFRQSGGRRPFQEGEIKDGEDRLFGIGKIIFLKYSRTLSNSHFRILDPHSIFHLGAIPNKGAGQGRVGGSKSQIRVRRVKNSRHPGNTVRLGMVVVEAPLVMDIAIDQQAGGDARGKSQDIDKGKTFMTPEVASGHFEIVRDEHIPRNAKFPAKGSLITGV
jgi:hypothetical protein